MLTLVTHRPRNVDTPRAAALLYGDWGTSKAYVIGLAYAIAGYASFWLILGLSLLSLFVGLSYTIICRCFPNGGGVYASVRRRSEVISIIGALFLYADYLVTAALSAVSAFSYFQAPDPILYAAIFICLIGMLNYFGPRHTGSFASIITIAALIVFTLLAIFCLPFLGKAWGNIQPPVGSPISIWTQFCSLIVALSGVEAIANMTGVMKLNKGTTKRNPLVTKTSTRAIMTVMTEVIIYTSLFGFAAAAISGYTFTKDTVLAPGMVDVRDDMLRFLGITFSSHLLGVTFGQIFGIVISIVVGLILLSAVNTSINGLISLQYLMSSDEELPPIFRKINRFGMPLVPLLLATVIPAVLVLIFRNLAELASLYAVGFVGAIAMNLGASSTDKGLAINKKERAFMLIVCLIMVLIEFTLFYDKPHALYFISSIMAAGLFLRWLTKKFKKEEPLPQLATDLTLQEELREGALLCVVSSVSKALQVAIEESNKGELPLNILFVREQKVISEKDLKRTGRKETAVQRVVKYVNEKGKSSLIRFHYSVTDSLPDIIAAFALRLETKRIILEKPKAKLFQPYKGDFLPRLIRLLPHDISIKAIEK